MLASLYIDLLISAIEYKGFTCLSPRVPRYVIADAATAVATAAAIDAVARQPTAPGPLVNRN